VSPRSFAAVRTLTPMGDGEFSAPLSLRWTIGGKPNGSYLLAAMARVVLRGWLALPEDEPFDPISLLYVVDGHESMRPVTCGTALGAWSRRPPSWPGSG
jgi:hypothetical protein